MKTNERLLHKKQTPRNKRCVRFAIRDINKALVIISFLLVACKINTKSNLKKNSGGHKPLPKGNGESEKQKQRSIAKSNKTKNGRTCLNARAGKNKHQNNFPINASK